jgi:hypothetical protein
MSTRNIIILIAAVVVVAVLGVVGWSTLRGPVVDAAIDESMKNGKLEGPARDHFVADSVGACVRQRPTNVAEDKFKQYCTCASEKAADLITPDEAKEINATGQMPDSLLNKLKEPMKQCLQSAGLLPAQ